MVNLAILHLQRKQMINNILNDIKKFITVTYAAQNFSGSAYMSQLHEQMTWLLKIYIFLLYGWLHVLLVFLFSILDYLISQF